MIQFDLRTYLSNGLGKKHDVANDLHVAQAHFIGFPNVTSSNRTNLTPREKNGQKLVSKKLPVVKIFEVKVLYS